MKTRLTLNIVFVFVCVAVLSLSACAPAATPTPLHGAPVVVQGKPTAAPAMVEKGVQATQAPALAMATAAAPTPMPVAVISRPGSQATVITPTPDPAAKDLPPEDMPADMFFKHYGVNPLMDARYEHLSTFAMDVDTASYTIMRRYITEGRLPPAEAVRVEEFVNFFNYDYPSPESGAFAIHLEGAPSPFGAGYYLLRVGLQGRRIDASQRKDAVLTFVIDVSGSMGQGKRLEMVKQSLSMLVNELRPTDMVGIVAYSTSARVVLEPTAASNKSLILNAIGPLQPQDSTNAEAGLGLGYQMASGVFRRGAINRVILFTDGVANVGQTSPDAILREVAEYAGREITLSTIGVGMGNYNDVLMEKLADKGNGNYFYVDNLDQAYRVLVENLTGTLQVIARDAKVQVDFNPNVVAKFRLLGYENRALANQDFRNDTVDAGEVGAGHNVTALYEIKLKEEASSGDALTVYVRYQDPDSSKVSEIAQRFARSQFRGAFEATSPSFQLAAAVAEFSEILRQSYWAKDSSLENVQGLAQRVKQALPQDKDVAEFAQLVSRASQLRR